MSKALVGRDGYLFLVNDFNGVQTQTSGKYVLSRSTMESIYSSHLSAFERGIASGRKYMHIVAPNKETAFRQFLPDGYGYETDGFTPLRQYMRSIPSSVKTTFFDPDLLLAARVTDSYDKGDSHWTPQGAIAYLKEAFFSFDRQEGLHRLNEIDLVIQEIERQGDLAFHAGHPSEVVRHATSVELPQVCLFEGDIVNEGYVRHYHCKKGTGRALILHDSFAHALFPFLSQVYAETLFVHCPNFLIDLENSFAPDVLIKLQAERFFPYVPEIFPQALEWLERVENAKSTSGMTTDYVSGILAPAKLVV